MRRVLIIAADYPPKLSIAARRPFGLSKYLPGYGWESIVLTISERDRTKKNQPENTVIESEPLAKPRFVKGLLDIIHKRNNAGKAINGYNGTKYYYQQASVESLWITKMRNILFYPDRYFISWYLKAVKQYFEIAKDLPVSAIISTAKPLTAHIIAQHIKRKLHVPWIADFRDLWPHWNFYEYEAYTS